MLTVYDANVVVGRPRNQELATPLATPTDLQAYVHGHDLAGALIWHWAQTDGHPESGNPLLADYQTLGPAIRIAWAILPPGTREQPTLMARLKQTGVAAVRLFPQSHRYLMNRVVWGSLLDQISEARLPVFLSLEHGCTWDQVYALLADYPKLTCVLCDIGTWSMDRYTYPLARYPNVYLETSMLAITDGGLEEAIRQFGATRLVFGSGFPRRYLEAARLNLTHARISAGARDLIAAQNLFRLFKETSL